MVILASEMTFIRKESFLNVEIQRQIIHDKMPESFQTTLRSETQQLNVNFADQNRISNSVKVWKIWKNSEFRRNLEPSLDFKDSEGKTISFLFVYNLGL